MPSIGDIQAAVCAEFDVSRMDLLSPRHARKLAIPRHVAMALARELTPASLPAIGAAFHRDHSTVAHAVRALELHCLRDLALGGTIARLRDQLRGMPSTPVVGLPRHLPGSLGAQSRPSAPVRVTFTTISAPVWR